MKLGLLLFLFGQTLEPPVWWKALNSEAEIRLRWNERFEEGYESSGLNVRLQAGLFPRFQDHFDVGVELSTFAGANDTAALNEGMNTKQIGFSQVFLGFQLQEPLEVVLRGGKWAHPAMTSLLLYNDDLRPEGFYESLAYRVPETSLHLKAYGAQLSLDQVDASRFLGERQKRVWAFVQGLEAQWNLDSENYAQLALSASIFQDPSNGIAEIAAKRGNSFSGSLGTNAKLTEDFAPLEAYLRIEGKPLGLSVGAGGAFAINIRAKEKDRGFLAEAHLGNKWKQKSFFLELLYFYSEPDLTIAAFAEESLGFTNRKGPRVRAAYFPLEQLKLGVSYLYASTVSSSTLQSARHELQGEVEVRF